MILSIGPQLIPNRHLDHVCDLCRKKHAPNDLIDIHINDHYPDTERAKRQLIVCPSCLGKLARTGRAYLANLILLGPDAIEETTEL